MSFVKGFIKRAQEYGLDYYQALELYKQAAPEENKSTRKEKAKEYIPQNAMGFLGDYLTPGGFGGYRAGKATALAKGLGKEPGYTTTNPISSSLLGMLGGGAGGAGLGHLADKGGLTEALGGSPGMGAAGGGLLGALAGYLAPTAMRRGDTKENLAEYAKGAKITPEKPNKLRGIGNITLPFSGPHRKGEAVGYNKLRGIDEDESLNTALNTAQLAPHPVGGAAKLLGGILQNYSADETMNKKK